MAVDRIGRGGGIAVLWRKSLNCQAINFSSNFINLEIHYQNKGNWRLTGFYGYPERHRRKDSWEMLRNLATLSNLPWCIIRDFDDLLSVEDKCGRVEHPPWLLSGFREAVIDCNLTDICLEGYPFTWSKGKGTDLAVEERLDRAMVTDSWFDLFPQARLFNLLASISDHSPILLNVEEVTRCKRPTTFKFENACLTEPSLIEVVRICWDN